MQPTQEQRIAIETHDRALVVEAGAGTGKTSVLTRRFIHLLAVHPEWEIDSIIAITFTRKAAREMRSRIRRAIEEKAAQNPDDPIWQERRRALDQLQISTIHSLCAHILKENAISAGIDPQFQSLDEQEADLLKEEAIRDTLALLEEEDDPSLALLASLSVRDLRSVMEELLAKRGVVQRLFSELPDTETLISTWEERLEEMRAAMWQEEIRKYPGFQLAMQSILSIIIRDDTDKLSGAVRSAQSGCQSVRDGDVAAAVASWSKIDRRGGKRDNWGGEIAMKELKEDLGILQKVGKALIGKGFDTHISAMDYQAAQNLQLWKRLWERLNQVYDTKKDEINVLDFDDLEMRTRNLLEKKPQDARLEAYLEHIRHLMVDEFQDTNRTQQRIIYLLAPPQEKGKLFVVGDAKQSIYRFRQAEVSVFNKTIQDISEFTGHPAEKLSISFRTHSALVAAMNALYDEILQPLGDDYCDFEARPGPLSAFRKTPRHQDESGVQIEILVLPKVLPDGEKVSSEDGRIWEARWLAKRLHELHESEYPVYDRDQGKYVPFEYRHAAVLMRATTQFPLYEAEFKAAGLPYLTVSGRGYYNRPEIQDLMALLASIDNAADDLNLGAVLRSPLFNLSDETLYRLRWYTSEGQFSEAPIGYAHALGNPPPTHQDKQVVLASQVMGHLWSLRGQLEVPELLREAFNMTAYDTTMALADGEYGRGLSNVNKFMDFARSHGGVSLSKFLRMVQDLRAREVREGEALGGAPESGAIQLMSIHAAKGLEFPVVCMADMGRGNKSGRGSSPYILQDPAYGIVCKIRDEDGEWQEPAGYKWAKWLDGRMDMAEDKRLLYVAGTRAADLLILTGREGNDDTWISKVLSGWEIEPSVDHNTRQRIIDRDDFRLQLHMPDNVLEQEQTPSRSQAGIISLDEIPPLVKQIPPENKPRPISISRLVRKTNQHDLPEIRPALYVPPKEQVTPKAPNYILGRVVHHALADWTCLREPINVRNPKLARWVKLEGLTEQEAVNKTVKKANDLLMRLVSTDLYFQIEASKRRFHELPFNLDSPIGVLHGSIDLLHQDSEGNWHLIDWKTEWAQDKPDFFPDDEHLIQIALYTFAISEMLDIEPASVICYLYPRPFPYLVEEEMLQGKLRELFSRKRTRDF